MKMVNISVKVSGYDYWNNPIEPYVRNSRNSIEWTNDLKVGTNILANIDTKQIEEIVEIFDTYEQNFKCDNCLDWGCALCCSSDNEIRARQGTFS